MALPTRIAAYLKNLAKGGDMSAKALVENATDITMSAGAEAANIIKVTGQIKDGVGNPKAGVANVLIKAVGSSLLTLADGGSGTVKAGGGTVECWMQTDSAGAFQVDVAQTTAPAGDYLIQATTDDGDVAMLAITFA